MQLLQVEVQCDCTVSYMCPALVIADNLPLHDGACLVNAASSGEGCQVNQF